MIELGRFHVSLYNNNVLCTIVLCSILWFHRDQRDAGVI